MILRDRYLAERIRCQKQLTRHLDPSHKYRARQDRPRATHHVRRRIANKTVLPPPSVPFSSDVRSPSAKDPDYRLANEVEQSAKFEGSKNG